MPHSGIDLPDIGFGAHTTLAYAQATTSSWSMLAVGDGRHAVAIALLGTYMAGVFVTAPGGRGGIPVPETDQKEQRPLLTHPQA